jgi:hypothetical protein
MADLSIKGLENVGYSSGQAKNVLASLPVASSAGRSHFVDEPDEIALPGEDAIRGLEGPPGGTDD